MVAFVNSIALRFAATNTDSASFGTLPVAGNAVMVAAWARTTDPAAEPLDTGSVTDNQGNTYYRDSASAIVTYTGGDRVQSALYRASNIASSGTFTITVTAQASVTRLEWTALQYSGVGNGLPSSTGYVGIAVDAITSANNLAISPVTLLETQAELAVWVGAFNQDLGSLSFSNGSTSAAGTVRGSEADATTHQQGAVGGHIISTGASWPNIVGIGVSTTPALSGSEVVAGAGAFYRAKRTSKAVCRITWLYGPNGSPLTTGGSVEFTRDDLIRGGDTPVPIPDEMQTFFPTAYTPYGGTAYSYYRIGYLDVVQAGSGSTITNRRLKLSATSQYPHITFLLKSSNPSSYDQATDANRPVDTALTRTDATLYDKVPTGWTALGTSDTTYDSSSVSGDSTGRNGAYFMVAAAVGHSMASGASPTTSDLPPLNIESTLVLSYDETTG